TMYARVDAGVLYVPWRFLSPSSRCVAELSAIVGESLDADVPLFSKQVARGIGMAEDPGQLRSFGQHRSELLAHGLLDAWLVDAKRDPVDAVSKRFEAAGLDPSCPWLNPGSIDHLQLVRQSGARSAVSTVMRSPPTQSEPFRDKYLEIADRIGNRICRDAIWSADACNWLEWDAEPRLGHLPDPLKNEWVAVHRALGANAVYRCSGLSLFAGTAGIALFLLRLFELTQDALHRETLIGVTNQIRQQFPAVTKSAETAFYTGWPGAAWVLVQVGFSLGDDELADAGLDALASLIDHAPSVPSTDIITGSAGLIAPLLDLAARSGRSDLSDVAVRLGGFLMSAAERTDEGWSWQTLATPTRRNLSGYGHGVAGIVCALAELIPVTGEPQILETIVEGLRYESSQFSVEAGNWGDHRARAESSDKTAYQFGWCHGAPGIGMGRLRLLELEVDSKLNAAGFAATGMPTRIRTDFETALATTVSKLVPADERGQREFCICHGLAGNSELPLLASKLPGRESLMQHAEQVAQVGIEQFEQPRMPWPVNLSGTGETPVLFNGMAGIGYFYLRMSNPDRVPSILLLRGSSCIHDQHNHGN
ncbi:MAG: T3SS effector HopA1 family protein, partial [Planctomycetota bacterium]|nr:T3SS effector HopA1 family protein [Planctomycetota bacterium]